MHTSKHEAEEVLTTAVSKYVDGLFNDAIRSLINKRLADPALGWNRIDAPLPGQFWPEQGGTYAGIVRGDDGTLFHLIVGPDSMDLEGQRWGGYDEAEDGATSIWDGMANTQALLESDSDHPAAQAIAQINSEHNMGWYLPAQVELSLCRATVRHLFKSDWYWSSTQYSSGLAWYQSFDHGRQYVYIKDFTGRVRPVRRLVIQ